MTESSVIIPAKNSSELTNDPIRILHVDDEASLLKASKQILEMQGSFQVDSVSSVEEAYAKLDEKKFDVIVSDYQMPTKDGLQFLKELKDNGNNIPFILFTGKGREEVAIEALNLGANRYFNKIGKPETVYGQLAHSILQVVEKQRSEWMLEKSEENFRSLASSSPVGIFRSDLEGNNTYANEKVCEFLGMKPKDILGAGWSKALHPEDKERVYKEWMMTVNGKSNFNIEFRFISQDKRKKTTWVSSIFSPLKDVNGNLEGFMGTLTDITQQKKSEKELKENEKRFRTLVEHMPIAVALIDLKRNKHILGNQAAFDLYCVRPDEFLSIGPTEIQPLHQPDGSFSIEKAKKLLLKASKGETQTFEWVFRRPNGEEFTSLTRISKFPSTDNIILASSIDITERKKTENSLRNRLQFEIMVSKISANLINAPTNDLDKTISEALKSTCQFMDAERCSIFLFSDNCTKLTNTHEWCSNPKDSQMSLLQGLPVEVFGYYFKILKKLKTIVVNRPDDLPNEAKNERKWSEEHGFRPLVFVPMIHKGALYGTVGYYGKVDKEQIWSKDAIEYLNILSDIFVNAMEHKRFEEEIKGLARFPSENPNPVLRIAKDGLILYANAASKSLLQEWKSEVNRSVPDEWFRHVSNVFHAGESQEIEIEYDNRVHSFVLTPVVDGSYVNVYIRDITERRKIEEALRESEERFRTISTSANDAIVLMDDEGIISYWNPAAENMFDYTKEEAIGQVMHRFLSPKRFHDDYNRGFAKFQETGLGVAVGKTVELAAIKKDGTEFPIELTLSALNLKGKWHATGIIRDVTERKRREEEMKRRLMKFSLDDGNLYLVKESNPALSLEAFKDLLNVGYRGLVVSRTPEEYYKKNVDGNFEFRWLAERGGEKSTPPKFEKIENIVEKTLMKSVVLLDCLDYLVMKNGFKEALLFVQRLREYAYLKGNVVVLSVDPSTLNAREVRLLEKECKEVESRVFVRLPEDLLEILRFIYEHNALGSKPNYTDIRQELSISKPTVGKRIKILINTGYVTENPRGRSKVLELTYKGMRLFLK